MTSTLSTRKIKRYKAKDEEKRQWPTLGKSRESKCNHGMLIGSATNTTCTVIM